MTKKMTYIRILLTIALLFFVWAGQMWAIKLSITLTALGVELLAALRKAGR